MPDAFRSIWRFEFQVLPVCIALAVVYLPTLVRRVKDIGYAPLYFSVYPLRAINEDLYNLYGWRTLAKSSPDDPEQAARFEREARRFKKRARLSYAIDAAGIPIVAGVVVALFLPRGLLAEFLVVLLVMKIGELAKSVYDFNRYRRGEEGLSLVLGAYIAYVFGLLGFFMTGYLWMRPLIEEGDYLGALDEARSVIFGVVLAPIIIAAVTAYIVTELLPDSDILNGG